MSNFNSSSKIGEVVAKFPKAADVFIENKIDFCCGGNRPLTEAVKDSNSDVDKIVEQLNNLYEKFKNASSEDRDWQVEPLDVLVEHILNTHHGYLWDELPRLSQLSTTILKVHGEHHPELFKVNKLFSMLKMELEEHLTKEETLQYPAINEYVKTKSQTDLKKSIDIIDELEKEHSAAGDILKELRVVTEDYAIPDGVCPTFELVYQKLQEVELDLFQHIHLENNILFPRLRELLDN